MFDTNTSGGSSANCSRSQRTRCSVYLFSSSEDVVQLIPAWRSERTVGSSPSRDEVKHKTRASIPRRRRSGKKWQSHVFCPPLRLSYSLVQNVTFIFFIRLH